VREIRVHFVCEGCGVAGAARVQPGRHAGDCEFACPACGHVNVAACAPSIGHVVGGEELPDMPVEKGSWQLERRRAVGVGSRSMGEGDRRWRAGE
jgi:hypothetical protein